MLVALTRGASSDTEGGDDGGGRSAQEVRDELERAHAAFVQLLDGLDASALVPTGAAREWVMAQAQHDDEHARELEAREGSGHESA